MEREVYLAFLEAGSYRGLVEASGEAACCTHTGWTVEGSECIREKAQKAGLITTHSQQLTHSCDHDINLSTRPHAHDQRLQVPAPLHGDQAGDTGAGRTHPKHSS